MSARRSIRWVLDHHFSRGSRSSATGSNTCSPRSTPRIRSMTAVPRCCTGRWPTRRPAWAAMRGAYASLMGPLVRDWDEIAELVLGPLRLPRHPLSAARFGVAGLRSAHRSWRRRFRGDARAGAVGGYGRPLDAAAEPPAARRRSRWCCWGSGIRWAGRSRAAGRRRSPTRWRSICVRWAA